MKLSVVIPVYRVEAFLRKCVDSVVSQEIDDMEIILVDDCSPDGSGRLCDTLACSDARIRVVHRGQNGGLSAARNSGLDVATGDCITFVDSDDFLSPGTYRACLQAMMSRQADCVEFPVMKRYGSENAEEYKPSLGEVEETFDEWYERRGYVHSYAWNKSSRAVCGAMRDFRKDGISRICSRYHTCCAAQRKLWLSPAECIITAHTTPER